MKKQLTSMGEVIMKAEFTQFDNNSNWVKGKIDNYSFEAKLFDDGSRFGINGGRVSKLSIWDEKSRSKANDFIDDCMTYYEREWVVEPEDIDCYESVMNLLENSPKRFE
jgi:hypothetical protein